ncbi:unnamed protein product [Eruca vesicaria subsp. sativa]|uniref:UBL3-like ubiquitin domain-containing protein n=1 Tax=Eruca vesicaria subsp. sativa TaxID=29727 RepID=A0ABC8LHK7_ERUVS|nr:unnamed protein product [Eruca vesicaria subsp. sativa]
MAGEDWIELKFRLADGTDIGPINYNQSMIVSSLKEKIISQSSKASDNIHKTVNDVKLINAGKYLTTIGHLLNSDSPLVNFLE